MKTPSLGEKDINKLLEQFGGSVRNIRLHPEYKFPRGMFMNIMDLGPEWAGGLKDKSGPVEDEIPALVRLLHDKCFSKYSMPPASIPEVIPKVLFEVRASAEGALGRKLSESEGEKLEREFRDYYQKTFISK